MRFATRWATWSFWYLLLATPPVLATDLTAKCTAPTMGTDPTTNQVVPLPADEAITFNLYGADQGQPLVLLTTPPLAACLSVRANVTPGATKCYAWTAVGTRTGPSGPISAESAQTAPICVPVPVQPQTPTGTAVNMVTTSTTVFMELQVKDGFSFLAVGTVPLGTPCDPTQRVNNFNVVPAAAVTWTGSIHRLAALAACSITN